MVRNQDTEAAKVIVDAVSNQEKHAAEPEPCPEFGDEGEAKTVTCFCLGSE